MDDTANERAAAPSRPAAPLIVTAMLGAADQRLFDALRTAHFPPERNFLAAHLTLFHHLPPARADELLRLLKHLAADHAAPKAWASAIYSLGRGVAFGIESPELLALRARVAECFASDLTPQDQGKPRLHITIQNKVAPAKAHALIAQLQRDFQPVPISITGFGVHLYQGGPWQEFARISFRGGRTRRY